MTTDARRAFLCLSHSPFMTLPGREHSGPQFLAAVEEAKKFIADFGPDVVVMFAPDHMHLLNQVRPPFTGILTGETVPEFGIPKLGLSVASVAARLFEEVVRRDVDLAVAEGVAVDHGLGLTLLQLFDEPELVPLVPVVVNAIGFPLFPVARSTVVGRTFKEALAGYDGKVLFVGTGGLSHHPPFPDPAPGAQRLTPEERDIHIKTCLDYLDADWDRELLAQMEAGDADCFDRLTQADIDRRGGGANEVRTWAAAWAAAGSPRPSTTAYELVEDWITGMGMAFGYAAY